MRHDHEVDILVDHPTEENRIFTLSTRTISSTVHPQPSENDEEDDEEHIELPAKDVNETTVGQTASTTHVPKKNKCR